MKKFPLSAVSLLVGILFMSAVKAQGPIRTRKTLVELAALVSESNTTWVADISDKNPFQNYTFLELRSMLGLISTIYRSITIGPVSLNSNQYRTTKEFFLDPGMPSSFDARIKWPACVNAIKNQGQCGSCYAVASTNMLAHRICAKTGTLMDLSIQDMVECSLANSGCNGGWSTSAVVYLINEGVVDSTCMPYVSSNSTGDIPYCMYRCDNENITYTKYHCKEDSMKLIVTMSDIMNEIITNGPVMVGFTVFDDFFLYRSGVYEKSLSALTVGQHAVKMIGWGTDNKGIYWICENQWTSKWGNQGYFNIRSSTGGIDLIGVSCDPDIVE